MLFLSPLKTTDDSNDARLLIDNVSDLSPVSSLVDLNRWICPVQQE